MHATIILNEQTISIILPLKDDFYGTASHVQTTVSNCDIERALAYYLPKITTITLDVYPEIDRSDVVAQLPSDKIIERRHAITRKPIA